MPLSIAACRTVLPFSTVTARPSIVERDGIHKQSIIPGVRDARQIRTVERRRSISLRPFPTVLATTSDAGTENVERNQAPIFDKCPHGKLSGHQRRPTLRIQSALRGSGRGWEALRTRQGRPAANEYTIMYKIHKRIILTADWGRNSMPKSRKGRPKGDKAAAHSCSTSRGRECGDSDKRVSIEPVWKTSPSRLE